jgi:4-hydroxy-tetrahydrodipicolinate synthase
MNWKGVMPAITTCFDQNYEVDTGFMREHCSWLLENGCTGIVTPGSLGEGATLLFEEKLRIVRTCIGAARGNAPVVAAVSSLSTNDAVQFAKKAADTGCDGLMVLPPYVYRGDWREMKAHVAAVFEATPLPCMLYNNPIAYGTDFLPSHIRELAAEHKNLDAVKESSSDPRRISAIRAIIGDRLQICVGVDDGIVESIGVGAVGWIAGLVNALPRESVGLFHFAMNGEREKTFELYRWFLPLLRMDTVPKFGQLIKLVQAEVGMGNARVRAPRLELSGAEREEALETIRCALHNRPEIAENAARN